MTTNPFSMRLRFLRVYTCVVCFCFTQFSFAQFEIATTVPTGFQQALHVGVGTAHFSVEITNGNSPISLQSIEISQPTGLDIVTASYFLNGQQHTADIQQNNILINQTIPAGSQFIVQYQKRATCTLIPVAASGYSLQVIDEVEVKYVGGTKTTTTNSYPVLFPGLQVNTPSSPLNNIAVALMEEFTDEIPIINARNAGSVQDMIFTMQWALPNALEIRSLELVGPGATITLTFTSTPTSLTVALPKSVLEIVGFEHGIMKAQESIILKPTFLVKNYSAQLQTMYSIDFKAFSTVCNRTENASGLIYYTQEYPNPILTVSREVIQYANYCGKNYIADITLHNLAHNIPSNYLLNLSVSLSQFNSTVISVRNPETQEELPVLNGRYIITTGTDLTGDGEFKDLPGGQSITIRVEAAPIYIESYQNTGVTLRFYGEKIDGLEINRHYGNVDQLRNTHSYATGPGTLDQRKNPTGDFSFFYAAEMSPFIELENISPHFLEYAVYVQTPDGEKSLATTSSENKYEGEIIKTITACQNDDLSFKLVLETSNCPAFTSIVTQATPNTVERCYQEGEGGCYGISVDTAYFAQNTINTCSGSLLSAMGNALYWCKEDCPVFTDFIVYIWDNTGAVTDFEVRNPVLRLPLQGGGALTGTLDPYKSRGHGVAYRFLYANLCEGVDSLMYDSLVFTGTVFIPTHLTNDITAANFQVQFIAVESNGTIHDATWSWGEALLIYDPKVKFTTSTFLNGCGFKDITATVAAAAPGTPNNVGGIILNSVEFNGVPQFYYTEQGYAHTGESLIYSPNTHIKPGESRSERKYQFPRCVPNNQEYPTPSPFYKISYTDFVGMECEKIENTNQGMGLSQISNTAQLALHPTEMQQNIEQFTTWTVQVENIGNYGGYAMLAFEVDPNNLIDMFIEEITFNGQYIEPQIVNQKYYVSLGYLNSKSQKEVSISVSYAKCTDFGISSINVASAWSCEELTAQTFSAFACNNPTASLQLENLVAVLSATETYSDVPVALCVDIPISVTLDNIGRADLTELGIWFEQFPENYTLTNNEIQWNYQGNSGSLVDGFEFVADDPIFLFSNNKHISQHILGNHLLADTLKPLAGASQSVQLDFWVQVDCGIVDDMSFIINGISNCGAVQEKKFVYKPKIVGFEYLDSLIVSAQGGSFSEYKGSTSIRASLTNGSESFVDSAYITIQIPPGFVLENYIPDVDESITGVTQIPMPDGSTILQWELAQGVHLAPGETIALTCIIRAVADCPQKGYVLVSGTLKRLLTGCNGQQCIVEQSTKTVSIEVDPPTIPFSAELHGTEETCVNATETYWVTGTNIVSVTWWVSPETSAEIVRDADLSIDVLFNKKDTVYVYARVIGQCTTIVLRKMVVVEDVPKIFAPTYPMVVADSVWNNSGISGIGVYPLFGERVLKRTIFYDNGCGGRWEYDYIVSNRCGSDTLEIYVEWDSCFCPLPFPWGNLANPHPEQDNHMPAVTTLDVEVLRYYVEVLNADPSKLIHLGGYEKYQIEMPVCDTYVLVDLVDCYPKWADINKDGVVDMEDVYELIRLVK